VAQTQTKTNYTEQLQETFLFLPFVRNKTFIIFKKLQVAPTTCYSFAPGLIHLRTISEKKTKFAVYVFHKKTGTNSTEKSDISIYVTTQRLKSHPVVA